MTQATGDALLGLAAKVLATPPAVNLTDLTAKDVVRLATPRSFQRCERGGCGRNIRPLPATACVACGRHFCSKHLWVVRPSPGGYLCDDCEPG